MHTHSNYRSIRKLLMFGTFFEYFDLMLYVHMASILNDIFLDPSIPWVKQYGTAISFCSTFALKPLGGWLWGWIGDLYGRKTVLVFSLMLMGVCNGIITSLPSYHEIGGAAFIILSTCRLLQGFASVGETNASEIYMAENVALPKRYFSTALISYAGVIGTVLSLVLVKCILWSGLNWRFAFLLGTIILFLGFLMRLHLAESGEFLHAKEKLKIFLNIDINYNTGKVALEKRGLTQMLHKSPFMIKLNYFCAFCGWPVCFYFSYVYCPKILQQNFGFTKAMVIDQNLILGLFNLVGLFFWIYLTKFIHPLKILRFKLFCYFIILFSVPWLFNSANTGNDILLIQIIIIIFGNSTVPAKGVFIMHFGTLERFKWAAGLNGIAHLFLYLITAFGIEHMDRVYGIYGIIGIFILITCIYSWGVFEFIKIEKQNKNFYIKF